MSSQSPLRDKALELVKQALFLTPGKRRFLSLYVREKASDSELKLLLKTFGYQAEKLPLMIKQAFAENSDNVQIFQDYFKSLEQKMLVDMRNIKRSNQNVK